MHIEHFSEDSTAGGPGWGGGDLGMWRAWPPSSGNLEQKPELLAQRGGSWKSPGGEEALAFMGGDTWKVQRGRVQEGRNWVCARSPT